jgi:hypothetical protein
MSKASLAFFTAASAAAASVFAVRAKQRRLPQKMRSVLKYLDFEDAGSYEQAESFFSLCALGGYLSDGQIEQAVDYLHAEHPFAAEPSRVIADLKRAIQASMASGTFSPRRFMQEFAKQSYFTRRDVVELLFFLSQTAFDRKFGVERDGLQIKAWMEEPAKVKVFMEHAGKLGHVLPHHPGSEHKAIIGVAVHGAASCRIEGRVQYLKSHIFPGREKLPYFALTGSDRELSKGLDEEAHMRAIAAWKKVPFVFQRKQVGSTERDFLTGVGERDAVEYFLQMVAPDIKMDVMGGDASADHWRAATKQNAQSIALKIIDRIQAGKIQVPANRQMHVITVAEQPYLLRMQRQVQRAFNQLILERGLDVTITVEACGAGLPESFTSHPVGHAMLTRLTSELVGSRVAEHCKDAICQMDRDQWPGKSRNLRAIFFNTRDGHYQANLIKCAAPSRPHI